VRHTAMSDDELRRRYAVGDDLAYAELFDRLDLTDEQCLLLYYHYDHVRAFDQLYRRYCGFVQADGRKSVGQLLAYALWLVRGRWDRNECAWDLVQGTFVHVIRSQSGDLQRWNRGSVRAWLYRILTSDFQDLSRRERCQPILVAAEDHQEEEGGLESLAFDPHPEPLAQAIAQEKLQRLCDRVERLPAELAEVVRLHYFQDLSAEEIADILGVTRRCIYHRLDRAREQLGRHLGDDRNP